MVSQFKWMDSCTIGIETNIGTRTCGVSVSCPNQLRTIEFTSCPYVIEFPIIRLPYLSSCPLSRLLVLCNRCRFNSYLPNLARILCLPTSIVWFHTCSWIRFNNCIIVWCCCYNTCMSVIDYSGKFCICDTDYTIPP